MRPPRSPAVDRARAASALRRPGRAARARRGDAAAQAAGRPHVARRRPASRATSRRRWTRTSRRFAEPLEGPTARRLAHLAQRFGTHLVGPLIEAAHGATHNAMVGYTPEGTPWLHYRKRHPWFPRDVGHRGCGAAAGGARARMVRDARHLLRPALPRGGRGEAAGRRGRVLFPSAWVQDETPGRRGWRRWPGASGSPSSTPTGRPATCAFPVRGARWCSTRRARSEPKPGRARPLPTPRAWTSSCRRQSRVARKAGALEGFGLGRPPRGVR